MNQLPLHPGLEHSYYCGKMQSLLQNQWQWRMAEKIKFIKLLLQNQASRWKSGRSDSLSNISLNCPPFASPWETDNRRKPPIELENASSLFLRWIQAANSADTFRKPKTRDLSLKRNLSECEMMPFFLPSKCKLFWLKCLIRTQWQWNTHKHTCPETHTRELAPQSYGSVDRL